MAAVVKEELVGAPTWLRLRWGAVFGGLFVALGVWILLYTLGAALGFSAIDPSDPASLRGLGIGAGVWGVVTPLIAFFIGGLVAARASGAFDRMTGAMHGAVFWGLATVAGLMLVGMALGNLVGAGREIAARAPAIVGGAVEALDLTGSDVVSRVNERLRAEGMPAVTAAQLSEAAKDAAGQALRQGRFDREAFIGALSQNTALSRAEAAELAGQYEAQLRQLRGEIGERAEQIAATTGKVFGGIFLALLLGLISAVLGSIAGVVRRPPLVRPQVGEPARREVYP